MSSALSGDFRLTRSYLSGYDAESVVTFAAGTYNNNIAITNNYFFGGITFASVVGNAAVLGNRFSSITTKRILVTGTAPALTQLANGIEGVTSTEPNNITIAPDWTEGALRRITCTGAAKTITLGPPVPTPVARGVRILLRLYNNNAGVTTWSVGAPSYELNGGAGAISNLAGTTSEIAFEYDLDRAIWVEISRSAHP